MGRVLRKGGDREWGGLEESGRSSRGGLSEKSGTNARRSCESRGEIRKNPRDDTRHRVCAANTVPLAGEARVLLDEADDRVPVRCPGMWIVGRDSMLACSRGGTAEELVERMVVGRHQRRADGRDQRPSQEPPLQRELSHRPEGMGGSERSHVAQAVAAGRKARRYPATTRSTAPKVPTIVAPVGRSQR